MEWISEHWQKLVGIMTLVITLAAAIAALTPTPKDDTWVRKIRRVVDILAFNFGHASNNDGKRKSPFRY